MQDNALIRLFLPLLQNGLPSYGYEGVTVKQSNQPTQQGINSNPTVYFYKVGDHRYGWLKRTSVWNIPASRMDHYEMQMYETKFALSSLVTQNPKQPYGFTASDLVNTCAAILQSSSTLQTLSASNVGMLRIQDVSNPYFTDDRDQFEAAPQLEFILTHRQSRLTTDPVINSYKFDIYRV
jgi:hypothetical protein